MDQMPYPPGCLRHLIECYLTALRFQHYAETTISSRRAMLGDFNRYCEEAGATEARSVTSDLICGYQRSLLLHRKRNAQRLALSTQTQRLIAVAEFFRWLTSERFLAENPAAAIKMPRTARRLPKNILTAGEIGALLETPNVATAVGLRDRSILEVLYSTGLRRHELCQLDLSHIDFDGDTVRVEFGKGSKDRIVPIGRRALFWLRNYLADSRPRLNPAGTQLAIFIDDRGQRLKPKVLGNRISRLIRRALPGRSAGCHALRHAFATGLLRNGCDIRHIQAMLGHARLETTAIYTHMVITDLIEAHRRFHPAERTDGSSTARPFAAEERYRVFETSEIIFEVHEDAVRGGYVAIAPGYGICLQGETLDGLRESIRRSVATHAANLRQTTRLIRLHFVRDELLTW